MQRFAWRGSRGTAAIATALLAVAAVIAGCGSSDGSGAKGATSADPIKIGMIPDLTGPFASSEVPFADGMRAVIKATNDAGGVNGHQIDLITDDAKGDVPTGLAAYEKVVKHDDVVGLIGSLNPSNLVPAILPKLKQDKVPSVGPFQAAGMLTKPMNPYMFAVLPTLATQVDVATGWQAQQLGKPNPRVASIGLTNASGAEWANEVKAETQKLHGTYVGNFPLDPTATDADAQMQKMIAAKPDFAVMIGSQTTAVIVMKSLQKFGAKIPVIGGYAVGSAQVYQAIGERYGKLLHYVNAFTPAAIQAPGTAQMVATAKKYGYGKDLDSVNFVNGWVVAKTMVAALKNAGHDVTRASVTKALEGLSNVDMQGLSPNVTYGPNNREGIKLTRPYTYDFAKKATVAVGQYTDYQRFLN